MTAIRARCIRDSIILAGRKQRIKGDDCADSGSSKPFPDKLRAIGQDNQTGLPLQAKLRSVLPTRRHSSNFTISNTLILEVETVCFHRLLKGVIRSNRRWSTFQEVDRLHLQSTLLAPPLLDNCANSSLFVASTESVPQNHVEASSPPLTRNDCSPHPGFSNL